jgi:serine/threonine-protein kinase
MDAREAPLPPRIGRYRIERLLGRGAMGRVLLARDLVLDRDVAVKLLRDDLGLEPDQRRALVDRMRQEAKACARVGHPHIVQLFDMGEEPSVGLYLVFEYASGTTLKERLIQGQLQPGAAAEVAREIGDALSTAHENGVLHRDVKPENIILTPQGSKIADFGIARVPDSTLTKNGGLLGTPAYSAPECIANGEFSAQSDQFSLAATLYEALSRRRAFPGEDAVSVASRITNEEPPGIAEACGLDPHVDGVLARALAKDPEKRFASTREFGDALAEALGRRSRGTLPTLPDERHEVQRRAESRSGARLLVGGVAAGALLGIAGIQVTSGLKEREHAALAESAPASTTVVAWISESPRPSSSVAAAPPRRSAPSASGPAKPIAAAPPPSAEPRALLPPPAPDETNDADAGR